MATESPDDTEVSVTMPPSLEEWLGERADALGVEPGEVLVQLASAYRAASELEDGAAGIRLDTGDADVRAEGDVEDRADGGGAAVAALAARLEALSSTHEDDVEDVRSRVLQLRDAVRDRAEEDHYHDEFRDLGGRLDSLSEDLEDVGADVADLTDRVDRRTDSLEDLESKLDRLAAAVLEMRDAADAGSGDEPLDRIRSTANRRRTSVADCHDCGGAVRIALLTGPECPHCGTAFRDLEESTSALGSLLDRRNTVLVGPDRPALEAADE